MLSLALLPTACSHSTGGGAGTYDPCPVVTWWADTSGAVAKPSNVPESLSEAEDIANNEIGGAEGVSFPAAVPRPVIEHERRRVLGRGGQLRVVVLPVTDHPSAVALAP